MKKLAFYITPLLLTGFMLPEKHGLFKNSISMSSIQTDGPYVMYQGDSIFIKYIMEDSGWKVLRSETVLANKKASTVLTVSTDEPGKTFTVKLKDELVNEKSEFKKVSKQLVLSDIEGNFKAFRQLLQANGVIDSSYNWTFGEGNLVLIGDFVDRGEQVTEVLWLIYSLEDKARAAGGYVHYVLGNHEIMNMSGDLRYLNAKYKDNSTFLNQRYEDLYGSNTELGRWLRTKNVIEKVGDMLYMHGGFSSYMNSIDLSLSDINEMARPFYADSTYKYPDVRTEIIYSEYGPFWYRGYYTGTSIAKISQIDSTLDKFKIKHIATGHTIIADTVSVHYKGKVFDLDVHHAIGLSGALLIEEGKFYRVTPLGEKFQLLE